MQWRNYLFTKFMQWFDSTRGELNLQVPDDAVDFFRIIPFIALHIACIAVFWVGFSATAAIVAIALYFVRIFAITGFYHRYFSHRTFKTSRTGQLVFAILGASALERGPIWWSAHHRHHHRYADQPEDHHSPMQRGFWWSHVGWFLSKKNYRVDYSKMSDLTKFSELMFLDRFDLLVPIILATLLFIIGHLLAIYYPSLHTNGLQLLVWGFCISTVVVMHATFSINSLAHLLGSRRYKTKDDSRNNFWLALLLLGEGWHNNHHHYPGATRQGFFWWEIDITYYMLRLLAAVGIIWDLRDVPQARLTANRENES